MGFKTVVMAAPEGKIWKRTILVVPFCAAATIAITVLFSVKVGGKRSFAKTMEWYWFLLITAGAFVAALPIAFLFYRWYIPYIGLSKNMTFDNFVPTEEIEEGEQEKE